jgi:predicted metal-dependent hydrolase
VLEDAWKAAPEQERALWKGLAQLAVGITHARRGNARGAATLLRRGAAAVAGYAPARPHGVDTTGLAASAAGLAGLIEQEGLAAIPEDALVPRLTVPAGGE